MDLVGEHFDFLRRFLNTKQVFIKRQLIATASVDEIKVIVMIIWNSQFLNLTKEQKKLLKVCTPILTFLHSFKKTSVNRRLRVRVLRLSHLRKKLAQYTKCIHLNVSIILYHIVNQSVYQLCNG
jgi:hypothetical protein